MVISCPPCESQDFFDFLIDFVLLEWTALNFVQPIASTRYFARSIQESWPMFISGTRPCL